MTRFVNASLFGCLWGQCPIKRYLPSLSKNGGSTPEGLACPIPTSMRPIFAGMGQVMSGFQTNRLGSPFGTNTILLHGVARYLSLLWQLNYFWKVSIVLYFQVKLLFTFRDIFCCCSSHHCHSMNLWRKLTGKWLNTNPDDI